MQSLTHLPLPPTDDEYRLMFRQIAEIHAYLMSLAPVKEPKPAGLSAYITTKIRAMIQRLRK